MRAGARHTKSSALFLGMHIAARSCVLSVVAHVPARSQEGRSILIGVGQAATSVEITREQGPDCSSGSTCGTSRCSGLGSGTWRAHHTPIRLWSARLGASVSLVKECPRGPGRLQPTLRLRLSAADAHVGPHHLLRNPIRFRNRLFFAEI